MTGFTAVTRLMILLRAAYRCEVCGRYLDTEHYSIHHRQPRKMGGTTRIEVNQAQNGLAVCGTGTTGCHGRIESDRANAERLGYLVGSWADPAQERVLVASRGWVLLTRGGGYTPLGISEADPWLLPVNEPSD